MQDTLGAATVYPCGGRIYFSTQVWQSSLLGFDQDYIKYTGQFGKHCSLLRIGLPIHETRTQLCFFYFFVKY